MLSNAYLIMSVRCLDVEGDLTLRFLDSCVTWSGRILPIVYTVAISTPVTNYGHIITDFDML